MTTPFKITLSLLIIVLFQANSMVAQEYKEQIVLPKPYETKAVKNFSSVVGWKDGQKPVAPKGFTVTKFADKLENPRWLYVAPNGDIFVAEAGTRIPETKREDEKDEFFKSKSQNFGSANRITMFRDANKDGIYDTRS